MPPPPQYKLLKHIILENYHTLQNVLCAPRFVPLRHSTLGDELVRTKLSPTDDQVVDIYTVLSSHTTSEHKTAGQLPQLNIQNARTKRCKVCDLSTPKLQQILHLHQNWYYNSQSGIISAVLPVT